MKYTNFFAYIKYIRCLQGFLSTLYNLIAFLVNDFLILWFKIKTVFL